MEGLSSYLLAFECERCFKHTEHDGLGLPRQVLRSLRCRDLGSLHDCAHRSSKLLLKLDHPARRVVVHDEP